MLFKKDERARLCRGSGSPCFFIHTKYFYNELAVYSSLGRGQC